MRREVKRWANDRRQPAVWRLRSRGMGMGSGDDEGGVEWRDVSCYVTDDASLVVHRNGDDPSVYSLSHAPTGRLIPTEAAGSPDPLIALANRLSRMTDWGSAGRHYGDRRAVSPGQEANLRGTRPVQLPDASGVGGVHSVTGMALMRLRSRAINTSPVPAATAKSG